MADTDELPVGGVSWYEARAYARFVRKDLPTVLEWNAAAIPEAARWVVPRGRYDATSPVRGGNARSAGPRGVYDLAVKPPAGSGFPWFLSELEIGATTGSYTRNVVFEAPVPVSGTLRDVDELPIEGAEIRAYAIIDVPDLGQRSIEVARATSAADGSYMLLLPARLE